MSLENRELFLRRTSGLGVVDVRCAESGCILVVAVTETDAETMDGIRILAAVEWPHRPIVVTRRVSIRQSGVLPRVLTQPISSPPPPPGEMDSDDEEQTG